jgi:general secretion pathway protein E
MVVKTSDAVQLREIAVREGMPTLRRDGLRMALLGESSLEEVLRVT